MAAADSHAPRAGRGRGRFENHSQTAREHNRLVFTILAGPMAVILLIKNLNEPLGTSRSIMQRADFDGLLPDRDRTELG
jgi:hypothetical protein